MSPSACAGFYMTLGAVSRQSSDFPAWLSKCYLESVARKRVALHAHTETTQQPYSVLHLWQVLLRCGALQKQDGLGGILS